jgi:phage shock protein A
MGFFDRLFKLLRANVNDIEDRLKDPAQVLAEVTINLQQQLTKVRESISVSVTDLKHSKLNYYRVIAELNSWQNQARIARETADEDLLHVATMREQRYSQIVPSYKIQLDWQTKQVTDLKLELMQIESDILENKIQLDLLKSCSQISQTQAEMQQLNTIMDSTKSNRVIRAYEKLEAQALLAEAKRQAAEELTHSDLEQLFNRHTQPPFKAN